MTKLAPSPFDLWLIRRMASTLGKHPAFDLIVQGGILHSFLGGFWFAATVIMVWVTGQSAAREREQRRLLTTLLGSFLALGLAVLSGSVVGWPPPNQNPELVEYYPIYITKSYHPSSFPSQSTAAYSAIAAGMYSARKLSGTLLWIGVFVLVALPRMYVGGHYPADIIGGLACGIAGYLLARYAESRVMARLLPTFGGNNRLRWLGTFVALLWTLQLATQFRDLAWVQRAISLYSSAGSLCIGGDHVFGQHFNGRIDEVRIYDRALSQVEIQDDMVTPIGAKAPNTSRSNSSGSHPNELVAAYSFEEGSGNTVTDASSYGNTGTITGATWTNEGRFGRALVFSGEGALVTVADATSLHLSDKLTIEAWVYPAIVSSDWRDVVYKEVDQYYLEATSGNQSLPAVGGVFSPHPLYAPSALPINTWTHLAATKDGKEVRLYVNGVEVARRP